MPNRLTTALRHLLPARFTPSDFSPDIAAKIAAIKQEITVHETHLMHAQAHVWALRHGLLRSPGYDISDGTFENGVALELWAETMRVVNLEEEQQAVVRGLLDCLERLERRWKDLQYREERRLERRAREGGMWARM